VINYEAVGIAGLYESFSGLAKNNPRYASMAVNDASRKTITLGKKYMPTIVNINAGYFNKDRYFVKSFSNPQTLTAIVAGRDKPTSLSAFAPKQGGLRDGFIAYRGMINAAVKPGGGSSFEAYLLRLRSGNLGLAVRSQTAPSKAYRPKQVGQTGLWLLYGPSVNQVFKSARSAMAPDIMNYLTSEYLRQLNRGLHG